MLRRFLTSLRREAWRKRTIKYNSAVQFFLFVVLFSFCCGCSIKRLAVNSLANALTKGTASVYASDDDPELVGEALPFALKTIEALLQSAPNHKGLLISAASGFVQYTHAYVLRPSNAVESTELETTRAGRERAARLFLRARDYGLRALELTYPGISQNLTKDPVAAVSKIRREDAPALYWTGAAWASAISVSKDNMALVGDLNIVRALMERALLLDESWGEGAIHEFFIVFAAGRTPGEGGGIAKAEEHFKRAMELNGGRSIGPLLAFAESVCVRQQDRAQFTALLNRALAFDVNQHPQKRLANILTQRKAKQLLEHIEELFYFDEIEARESSMKSESTHD